MKKGKKYLVNPVPFSMVVANPRKNKCAVKKRRNPIKARSSRPGVFVIRAVRKNPGNGSPIGPFMGYARNMLGSGYNCPALKLYGFRTESSLNSAIRRAVSKPQTRNNPMKKRRRRRAKNKSSFFSNFMATKRRRRGKSRSRNPISRGVRRRSGRRSSRRVRNPLPVVRELFAPDMLSFAAGVVVANVGTTMIMNRINSGQNGQRSFDLPGVDYTMLGTPQAATFYMKNAWALALYKLAIGGVAGWALKGQSPRLARGIMVGSIATAISDVLKNTGVLSAQGTLGVSRYFGGPRGTGAYTPGVPAIYTGPASAFLNRGAPVRRGAGAIVNNGFMRKAEMAAPNPFGN